MELPAVFAPGIEIPGRDFTLENGESFYVIIDGFIVESNTEGFVPGTHLPLMFTFEHVKGRVEQEVVAWTMDASGNLVPLPQRRFHDDECPPRALTLTRAPAAR